MQSVSLAGPLKRCNGTSKDVLIKRSLMLWHGTKSFLRWDNKFVSQSARGDSGTLNIRITSSANSRVILTAF